MKKDILFVFVFVLCCYHATLFEMAAFRVGGGNESGGNFCEGLWGSCGSCALVVLCGSSGKVGEGLAGDGDGDDAPKRNDLAETKTVAEMDVDGGGDETCCCGLEAAMAESANPVGGVPFLSPSNGATESNGATLKLSLFICTAMSSLTSNPVL